MRKLLPVVVGCPVDMVGVLLAVVILGSGVPATPCDLVCEQEAAALLIDGGEPREAVSRLRGAIGRFPDDRQLVLQLARAYLVTGNLFWAERTLRDAVSRWPDDGGLRAWLAAVHMRQGDPELVRGDLIDELEPAGGPQRTRWRLLEASRARLAGDRAAANAALSEVVSKDGLFSEDRAMWRSLRASSDPWWTESVTGTLEVGAGHTSNALAGSPTDPGAAGGSSTLGLIELRSRLTPPVAGALRPACDLEIVANAVGETDYRELSTLQGSFRLGGMVVGGKRRVSFGYRGEALFLDQDSSLYAEAHRGEVEIEWTGGTVIFAGGGRRAYRDGQRSRWEGDIGFGGPLHLFANVPLVAGGTIRFADATSQAYDQLGVSAAVSARVPIARGYAMQVALTGGWEDYPHSGGAEGRLVFGTEEQRRDLLARASLTLRTPPWHGLRPAVEARYTNRSSTADEAPGFDFSYREWRVVAWLRWSFGADPWAPPTIAEPGHVPLDWGVEGDSGMDEERILDLLRGDEELRRGSSCGLR